MASDWSLAEYWDSDCATSCSVRPRADTISAGRRVGVARVARHSSGLPRAWLVDSLGRWCWCSVYWFMSRCLSCSCLADGRGSGRVRSGLRKTFSETSAEVWGWGYSYISGRGGCAHSASRAGSSRSGQYPSTPNSGISHSLLSSCSCCTCS